MAEQKTVTQIVGSSIANWVKDPATGKERTPQEIIAAVKKAVLADKSNTYGTTLDPLTGQARPATDAQKVQIALSQLAANADFERPRYEPAKAVARTLVGGGSSAALANRPDLWTLGKETVGTVIDRQNFGDAKSSKRFVVDPTKGQLTPEQLKEFIAIGAGGGMAIDPVTGFQVDIDSQGRYTLGEQPSGDVTGLNYATGQRSMTSGGGIRTGNVGGTIGGGDPNTLTAGDGTKFDNLSDYMTYQNNLDEKRENRQSAYDLLYSQFKEYGLESLVTPLKGLIETGISPSEFTIKLRETDSYKKRFGANQARIAKGLRALSEAEYTQLEDQYQDVMRRYGLPENYYARGDMGRQEGFEKFLAGDVSPVELEDRIQTAQKRVLNANPEVTQALKQFYPDITNADILAYTLDPKNAIENIKRKVTAAEIGGAAIQAGIGYSGDTPEARRARAEELRAAGVTKETAQQGFGTIAGGLQRGSQLASIYGNDAYNQTTAEQEVFGLAGAQEARKQRQKITGLEKATFGGQTGLTSGALARDRAGAY